MSVKSSWPRKSGSIIRPALAQRREVHACCPVSTKMPAASSSTWLLTLGARACADAIGLDFEDTAAKRVTARLGHDFTAVSADAALVRGVVLRTQYFDRFTLQFFARCPSGTALVLGAGLCTRLSRLASMLPSGGDTPWTNIDLPEVCALREQFLPAAAGERNLACSLLDLRWLDLVQLPRARPLLVLLEGVCPYLPQQPLQELLCSLVNHCRAQHVHATIVLDFVHPGLLLQPMQAGGMVLRLQSSFAQGSDIVALHPALRLCEQAHPYGEFSPRHQLFADAFAAIWERQPYTIAALAVTPV